MCSRLILNDNATQSGYDRLDILSRLEYAFYKVLPMGIPLQKTIEIVRDTPLKPTTNTTALQLTSTYPLASRVRLPQGLRLGR